MAKNKIYIGMGGNFDNTEEVFCQTLDHFDKTVSNLEVSNFYLTTPVSDIIQNNYLNAVCAFETALQPIELYQMLQNLESQLGKKKKVKNGPRLIDLDILFYYNITFDHPNLQIPHSRWFQRLFVLKPLRDLTKTITVGSDEFDIDLLLSTFKNPHNEAVKMIERGSYARSYC